MITTYENLPADKRIYVASDFHLGHPNVKESQLREEKIGRWLDSIKHNAQAIILAGDLFDFWFEYKQVVPKGFLRFYAKLIELKGLGIDLIFFTGNHDIWMFDYFERELGATIHREPKSFLVGKHNIQIGHGDGLGPGDLKFKFFKSIFTNKLAQWGFKWIHPDLGIKLATAWSGHSKGHDDPFLGEKEPIFIHCMNVEESNHHDYYIFGHRHIILDMPVGKNARYYNTGEWIENSQFIEISNTAVKSLKYEE